MERVDDCRLFQVHGKGCEELFCQFHALKWQEQIGHGPQSTDLFYDLKMLRKLFTLREAKLIVWSLRSMRAYRFMKKHFRSSSKHEIYKTIVLH